MLGEGLGMASERSNLGLPIGSYLAITYSMHVGQQLVIAKDRSWRNSFIKETFCPLRQLDWVVTIELRGQVGWVGIRRTRRPNLTTSCCCMS